MYDCSNRLALCKIVEKLVEVAVTTQISDIRDVQTRNVVRGVNANKETYKKVKTIEHAYKSCPTDDIYALSNVLLNEKEFETFFGELKPENGKSLFHRIYFPISVEKSRLIIKAVLEKERTEVSDILLHIKEITSLSIPLSYAIGNS